ncbi:MAG: GNAT family N-acetyltransferase [Ardenticatenaceae bacterium]|nr:GNAT family N-acetyltransferase [Anaerolineales bacterium]MCB8923956.1 GNAT family N-acetyltransferase [Ardenticatenaceae bacterium]MCB8990154.1 GNAT family N-acetyltransferase [Ardenticatenaceae bacterium]MCB9005450.1 GNAT family N-acetyltransferase [Ardenticatenaceae bacterium]
MREIRELTEQELAQYVDITANAYPGMKIDNAEKKEHFRERITKVAQDPGIHYYGLFADGEMQGVMRFHDFTMKLLSVKTLVGGLGGVAVDLLHKKEKVARDMVQYFLQHYHDQGACLTALYPFRHDFYRQMGFGYGSQMNQYSIKPDSLPRGSSKANVVKLTADDKDEFVACYERLLARTNGLMEKQDASLNGLFESPTAHVMGYKQDGKVRGYMIFTFRANRTDQFLDHDIIVREFVYDDREAMLELLTFLHTQADQVNRIVFVTQDEQFYFLLQDPRNGTGNMLPSVWHESNTQGVGLMYRVIDMPRLFAVLAEHDFGGQTCHVRLALTDSFMPENAGEYGLGFVNGRYHPLSATDQPDITISMDVAEFSSLITGAIGFKQLYHYGLADISDTAWLDTVHRLFWTENKPLCLTSF